MNVLQSTAMALCLAATPVLGMMATETAPPENPPAVVSPAPAAPAPAPEAPQAKPQFQQEAEQEWQRLQEVWDALPKRQKEQLYKAMEGVDKADLNFIDKAAELNLLTPEVAEKMREYVKGRTARIREDGGLPMYRSKGHK